MIFEKINPLILEQKEKEKEDDKQWKKDERKRVNEEAAKLGKSPPKRLKRRIICSICKPRLEFEGLDVLGMMSNKISIITIFGHIVEMFSRNNVYDKWIAILINLLNLLNLKMSDVTKKL